MASDIDRILASMEYGCGKSECLALGIYRGFQYAVYNILGNHPCGYVNISEHQQELMVETCPPSDWPDPLFDWEYFSWIECHGGVTYAESGLGTFAGGYWIGWDYAHLGDYDPHISATGVMYTTEETVFACKDVIDQICERLGVTMETKVYTAQEMREMADKLDNTASGYAICHYDGNDDEWRPLWMQPNSAVLALRQAANAMEREEKREKKYEYAVEYDLNGKWIMYEDRLTLAEAQKLSNEKWRCPHRIVRREVGEWEEVKDGE